MTSGARRRLKRIEIGLLKYLALFSPSGIPIIVPYKFQSALVPLWRELLIHIWRRQDPDGRRAQFVSITVDGARRIDAILHSINSRRLASSLGQDSKHDQPSKSEQDKERR